MDEQKSSINWFPGHMAKTRKMMEENIRLVDAVVEVVDARIPYSSKNPYLDRLWSRRPRVMVLNKSDLADPVINSQWQKWYEEQGMGVVLLDSLHGKNVNSVIAQAREVCAEKLSREHERGRERKSLRLMITGIPNVGKSTLINQLSGRGDAAKTGNMPGVTRAGQWIRLRGNVELLDTPGMLWPKFEDPRLGQKIAAIGSIRDEILDIYETASWILSFLAASYPALLSARYKLTADELALAPLDLLEAIGAHRGFRMSGGRIDLERSARMLVDEFRAAKIGRITLERPKETDPSKEEQED